jgi:hypothetical protein
MTTWHAVLRGVAAASLALTSAAVATGDDAFVVEPADARTNYFAGREVECDTAIRGGIAVEGRLVWALAAGNRSLTNGAVPVRHAGRGATNVAVSVPLPAGRDGVVADATLTTVLTDAAGNRLGAATRNVRIFPADPFFDRSRWLESLRIAIIDPEGGTEKRLTAAGVPLMLTRADADIAALRPQLILVAEGLAWDDHPRLAADLFHHCGRGVNVLCMAPSSGTFPLPGGDAIGDGIVASLTMRRADVVADLDERLDWRDWAKGGATVVSRLSIVADREVVVARAGATPAGWPWLEATFGGREGGPPAGTLVVCGLGIVAHWEETPAARYLLAALLARLAAPSAAASPDFRPFQENPR